MVLSKRWIWGARLGFCLIISGILLCGVMRMVSLSSIAAAFNSVSLGWFLAAVLLYGVVLLPAAVRWHLVLRLARAAVSPPVTLRYTLIGHFFYTILFGAIGGDSIKAALYARRFNIPFPRLLATAPLDRFLGLISSIIFGVVLLITGVPHLKFAIPWTWLLVFPIVVAVACLVVRQSRMAPACRSFVESFLSSGRMLLALPWLVVTGICCSLLSQVALSGVLALSLRAVSHSPLPWSQMLWTFPIIIAIGALPISIAGLGTREAAAVMLLAPYGVSSANATSASLLSLAAILVWAAAGAMLTPQIQSFPRRVIRRCCPWAFEQQREVYPVAQTD